MMRQRAALLAGVLMGLGGCATGTPTPPAEEKAAPPVFVQVAPPATIKARTKRATSAQKPILQTKAAAEEGPNDPRDQVNKQIADWLRPSEAAFAPKPFRSRLLAGPPALERPELPPVASVGPMPTLPPISSKPLLPPPLPEELPLAHEGTDRRLPSIIKLPAGALVRVAGPDVKQPPPLPILARPQTERAGATDPTAESSQEAVLAAPAPVRTKPIPPDRPRVPDPFENAHAVQLRAPPPEPPLPPQELPRTPGK
jgi:hypothetical protein